MTGAMSLALQCAVLLAFLCVANSTSLPSTFTRGQCYPPVVEEDASGAIRDIVRLNSRRYHSTLVTNNSTDIEFANATSRIMTPRTRQKLLTLSAKVKARWPSLKLKVLKSWTDDWLPSDPKSLHYEGRASDFVTSDGDPSKLRTLAVLAAEVGFDWVKYPTVGSYIHGSVISEVCQTAVDLLFVLDGSGSVKAANFAKAKNFVKNVIDFFDVALNGTHIAVIQYGTNVSPHFGLNNYYTMSSLKAAVDRIPYRGGYTHTAAALDYTRQVIFKEGNGARPQSQGVPRIVVFMTDGKSNIRDITQSVNDIKQTSINIFSIGIGNNIDVTELNFIASSPVEQHVFLLASFNDIAGFVDRLSAVSCDEPAVVDPGDNTTTTVDQDDFKYFKAACEAFGNNITIEQHDLVGQVYVYASVSVQNPSPLDPPEIVFRNESNSVVKIITVVLPSNTTTKLVYVSVQGRNATNMFTLYIWDTLFQQSNYDAYVTENARPGTFVFQVEADFRSGFNFSYTIINGNFGNAFSIDPFSGNITTNRRLDREAKETYVLSILAQDMRLDCHRGKAQVTVIVQDINDNHPVFTTNNQVTVVEDVTAGHLVTQITATDRDKGVNSAITYSMPSTGVPFAVNAATGELRTTGGLDRETQDFYRVTVTARDGGGLTKSVNVSVSVLDVNDNRPTFSQSSYSGVFNPVVSRQVAVVAATDPDLNENGTVRYQLDSSSRVGSHNYTVTVTGHDLGTPRQSRNVPVLVTNRSPCPLLQFSVNTVSGIITANTTCSPPVIVQGPENATVEAGQTVSLTCIADGQPTPTITWFFDGNMIPDSFVLDPSNFTLVEVAPVHSGLYHCEAVNEVGQARSSSAYLSVYDPGVLIGVVIQVDNPSDDGSCQMFDQNDFQSVLQTVADTGVVTTSVEGDICDQSPCLPNPCNNEGLCVENGDSFTCSCKPGWSGSVCNVDINECDLGICVNNGNCSNTQGSFTCSCPAGYGGHMCDLVTDACGNSTCEEDEDCVLDTGGHQCVRIGDGLVATVNPDGDVTSFVIEEDIQHLLGLTQNRKRRAAGSLSAEQSCRVRLISQEPLSAGTVRVKFVVLCSNGSTVSPVVDNSYCERLVGTGISSECKAGDNGLLVSKQELDPTSVSVHFYFVDPETGNALPASQALALFDSKNIIALLSQLFGYNITSVSAVHPNVETAAQSSGVGAGGIAGIVISVLVISAAVIAVIVWKVIRSRQSKEMKPVPSREVVYDDAEEGNVQSKSQQSHATALPMEHVYGNAPLTKSNSLGVPQPPPRWSQTHLLSESDSTDAKHTEDLNGVVLANPMYQYPAEAQSWFHGEIDRHEAEARLSACGQDGAYLIRVSSKGDGYSLSVYTPHLSKPYRHVLIQETGGQFKLVLTDSSNAVYKTLNDIVSHYAENRLQFGNESTFLTTVCYRPH